jgi:hypothetical protein
MTAEKQYRTGNMLRNQALAVSFLVIEVLAALQIGFGNVLAWLLMGVACWNLALFIIGIVGTAMIASEALNNREQGKP